MTELKGMLMAPSSDPDAADDAITFEALLPRANACRPRPRADLSAWGKHLLYAASALLAHWNSARIERAALAHALRWTGTSELARQVDRAFEYYLAWMEEVSELYRNQALAAVATLGEVGQVQGLELLRVTLAGLLGELRSRLQFIQTRAADIRISGKLEEVAGALIDLERDRLTDALLAIIEKQASHPDRAPAEFAADVGRLEDAFPELPHASAQNLEELGQRVAEKGRNRSIDVLGWLNGPGRQVLTNIGSGVATGVAGNAAYAWLVHLLG